MTRGYLMRTLRLVLVGAVIVALLGGLGGTVVAQSEEVSTPTVVTGNETCTFVQDGRVIQLYGDVFRERGYVMECEDTMSDPRVTGTYTNVNNFDYYKELEESFGWGTHVLEGPTGGWDCSYAGTSDPSGANDGLAFGVCPGTGEYDGLTYVFQHVVNSPPAGSPPTSTVLEGDFGDGTSIFGLIFEGASPVTLEVVEPPAE
jgi:hypothetical protein